MSQNSGERPIELLPHSIDSTVFIESSWDTNINYYYRSVGKLAYEYTSSFYKNIKPPKLYIKFHKGEYFVDCDNINHNFYTNSIWNVQYSNPSEEPGLYLLLPDRCQDLQNLLKMIDIGMEYFEEIIKCKTEKALDPDYHGNSPCELSQEMMNERLEYKINRRKKRFLNSMTKKYHRDLIKCIYISNDD